MKRKVNLFIRLSVMILALLVVSGQAHAVTVRNAAELQNAVSAANSGGTPT